MSHVTYIVLESGSVYKGIGFGFPAPRVTELKAQVSTYSASGELVFNTAHSGYHEVLTDPSYTGQIVAMTYPHIGNYGVSDEWNESGPEDRTDVRKVKASGFAVRSVYRGPVGEGRRTLDAWLNENKIPGISEIDTRKLTLELRDHGSKIAVIVRPPEGSETLDDVNTKHVVNYLKSLPSMEGLNLIGDVGTSKPRTENPKGSIHVALIDCGLKANIVRELVNRDAKVTIFPSTTKAEEILSAKPDGVLVSNGPGDPAVLSHQIELIKGLIGKLPVTGICLGHQLISLALGSKTYKMKFGHHGINHPVRDERTKKVFVTSQNHGFAVDEKTLPKGVEVWFRNANDQTVEGVISDSLKLASAQFHPESAPGPYDSHWIFEVFLALMKK